MANPTRSIWFWPLYKAWQRVSRQILQTGASARPHIGEFAAIFKDWTPANPWCKGRMSANGAWRTTHGNLDIMTAAEVISETGRDFIRDIVAADREAGRYRKLLPVSSNQRIKEFGCDLVQAQRRNRDLIVELLESVEKLVNLGVIADRGCNKTDFVGVPAHLGRASQ